LFQACGVRLGIMIMNVANMGTGLIIAFIYGWQLTLLILAFLPLLIIGGFLQVRILAGVAGQNKQALEEAGKVG
jgi:ABC-type bacteriocin/lantibiotic exporter with double-glycine peptidase domain